MNSSMVNNTTMRIVKFQICKNLSLISLKVTTLNWTTLNNHSYKIRIEVEYKEEGKKKM
jgi:hypothetical protein